MAFSLAPTAKALRILLLTFPQVWQQTGELCPSLDKFIVQSHKGKRKEQSWGGGCRVRFTDILRPERKQSAPRLEKVAWQLHNRANMGCQRCGGCSHE